MNKKNWILLWAWIAVFLIAIWTYFFVNNKNFTNLAVGWTSYTYNYTFSWMVKDRKKIDFNWNIDAWLYFDDNWLKERVKLDKLDVKLVKWDEKVSLNWSWLDIIQDEYKKYIKLWNLVTYNDWEEKPFDEKKLKTNIYYYLDDEIFKKVYTDFGNRELIKVFLRSILTSNPEYYLEKNKFFLNLKKAILSEKLLNIVFVDKDWHYVISDVVCKLNNREYKRNLCEREIKQINNMLDINFERKWNVTNVFIKDKLVGQLNVKITYKNKIFDSFELKYSNIANIQLDAKWIKYINIDYKDKNWKLISKYKRWEQWLSIDANFVQWWENIELFYNDGKWNLTANIADNTINVNYENNKLVYISKSKKWVVSKLDIDFNTNIFSFNSVLDTKNKVIFKYTWKKVLWLVVIWWKKWLTLNFNTETKEWKLNINTQNLALNLLSTNTNGTLHIKWDWFVLKKSYNWQSRSYENKKYNYELDIRNWSNVLEWTIKTDFIELNINANYWKTYDITINWKLQTRQEWNLKIKWTEWKWTITFDMWSTPLFISNYNINKELTNVNIDFKVQFWLSIDWFLTRKYENWDDTINMWLNFGTEQIFALSAKWKITKWWLNFELPQNYERVPEKMQVLSMYSLPNFDTSYALWKIEDFKKMSFDKYFTKYYIWWVIVWLGIVAPATLARFKMAQTRARDTAKKAWLWQIRVALLSYYGDYGKYPDWKSTNDIKTAIKDYLPVSSENSIVWKRYFYRSLNSNWVENAWFILWAHMENSINCDVDINTEKELEKLLKDNNYEAYEIKKRTSYVRSSKKWCYYLIIWY